MADGSGRDASESVLHSMSEEDYAELRREDGARVVRSGDQFWEETHRGFYQAIHWMARMDKTDASRPTRRCWGYRTTLQDDAADAANGCLPLHLLQDVDNYDMAAIGGKRRNQLRKCRKQVRIVEVTDRQLLQDKGYEVLVSSRERTQYTMPPSREQYLAGLDKLEGAKCRLVLAGLVDGELGGYIDGCAVEGTAYVDSVFIATETLPTQIGTGLIFDFVQACRRSGQIREVVYGQHSREDAALVRYKEGMLFPVVPIPTKVHMNGLIRMYIRWRHKDVYYRLTGED